MQRLPIEPISQASATQRAGRCGRVADGICIRLYAEDDFDARPEFTDPEIQRTNLASVILQMAGAKLGPVEEFPFVDPPEKLAVRDGVRLLTELGALVDGDATRLSETGRRLARLPVDPRIGRMVLEADKLGLPARGHRHRRRPLRAGPPRAAGGQGRRGRRRARPLHRSRARTSCPGCTCGSTCARGAASSRRNQFRKRCGAEFLNFLRIREWQDLAAQIRQLGDELGLTRNEPGAELTKDVADRVHQALLSGLLSQIGLAQDSPSRAEAGCAEAQAPSDHRVRGLARCPLRDLAGLHAGEAPADDGHGRRAGGDVPAVGAHGGGRGPGVGRGRGGRPRHPHVLRAALVEATRQRRGHRARHAVRRPARHGPHRRLRAHRPRGGPRAPRAPRAGRGRLEHPARVRHPQPRAPRAGRRDGAPRPPRAGGRRRRDLRLLRRARARRRRLGAALRPLVAEGLAARPAPARPRRRARCWPARPPAPSSTPTAGTRAG